MFQVFEVRRRIYPEDIDIYPLVMGIRPGGPEFEVTDDQRSRFSPDGLVDWGPTLKPHKRDLSRISQAHESRPNRWFIRGHARTCSNSEQHEHVPILCRQRRLPR